MEPGTIVRLPDGREGTVVYHGLVGYGIRWGRHDVSDVGWNTWGVVGEEWKPEAMLRDDYPSADCECVGEECTVIDTPETP